MLIIELLIPQNLSCIYLWVFSANKRKITPLVPREAPRSIPLGDALGVRAHSWGCTRSGMLREKEEEKQGIASGVTLDSPCFPEIIFYKDLARATLISLCSFWELLLDQFKRNNLIIGY